MEESGRVQLTYGRSCIFLFKAWVRGGKGSGARCESGKCRVRAAREPRAHAARDIKAKPGRLPFFIFKQK
jgi:hypothetical protein